MRTLNWRLDIELVQAVGDAAKVLNARHDASVTGKVCVARMHGVGDGFELVGQLAQVVAIARARGDELSFHFVMPVSHFPAVGKSGAERVVDFTSELLKSASPEHEVNGLLDCHSLCDFCCDAG